MLSRTFFFIVISCLMISSAVSVDAQDGGSTRATRLKGVLIYHAGEFTTWPAVSQRSRQLFTLCLIGEPLLFQHFEKALKTRKIQEKKVRLINLMLDESVSQVKGRACDLLYVGGAVEYPSKLLGAIKGAPVLTIGESENFLMNGGMIRVYSENNRMKYRLNLQVIRASGLKAGSRLLELASSVQ